MEGSPGIARREQMWRYGALLFGAGALVTLAGLALPHQPEVDEPGLAAVALLAALVASVLALARGRLPERAYHLVLALGTVTVSLGLFFNGERHGGPAGVDEMYYLWVVLYAAYYLGRAGTAAQVVFVMAAHALTLTAVDPGPIAASRWISLAGLVTGAAVVVRLLSERRDRLVAELEQAARTDPLTGLANRRAFEEAFGRELARAQREGTGFAVVLADIDRFKELNDRLGHVAGDDALIAVGRALLDQARGSDLVARFGGDEFAVVLAGTDAAGATEVGERVARVLCEHVPAQSSLALSFGVAEHGRDGRTLDDLVRAADAALYASKRERRPADPRARRPVAAPRL
ncbi:MAG: GGDEF domain-containing protein [Thermoleophilaceae bacterium]